jgi:glutathione S-transferase
MIPIITAIEQSPDLGRGLARDMPVRWALEEVGQPYEARLVSFSAMKQSTHRALQPFGQIPTYEEGDLALFELGAIVFHIAERHAGLLPNDANARARAVAWMFAALCTAEPLERLPIDEDRARNRLTDLSVRLGEGEWLDGAFTAGDLLMVQVLRRLHGDSMLDGYPSLVAYIARGEARPAFKRAFDAQLAALARTSAGPDRAPSQGARRLRACKSEGGATPSFGASNTRRSVSIAMIRFAA